MDLIAVQHIWRLNIKLYSFQQNIYHPKYSKYNSYIDIYSIPNNSLLNWIDKWPTHHPSARLPDDQQLDYRTRVVIQISHKTKTFQRDHSERESLFCNARVIYLLFNTIYVSQFFVCLSLRK